MARFDVHQDMERPGYLLDCQADILSDLDTRFVVPLVPAEQDTQVFSRLNPVFVIDGRPRLMKTQLAAAVRRTRLGPVVDSLGDQDHIVSNALDMLLTGI